MAVKDWFAVDRMPATAEVKQPDNAFPMGSANSTNLWEWLIDRKRVDTSRLGDGTQTSLAAPVISSFAAAFSEPPLRLFDRIEGEDLEVESEAIRLWAEPTPWMVGELMTFFIVNSIVGSGSAYLYKLRDAANRILQLLPLYPNQIAPHTPDDGSVLIDYWEYQPPGSINKVRLATEDVIQLRWQLDPADHRLGLSPLRPILTEIFTDDEAGQFSSSLLSNLGIPGVVLSPMNGDDLGPDPEEAELMGDEWVDRFSGPNRGRPYIPTGGMRAQIISFSPEQMNLTSLRRVPEERVSAALGWPAILTGLGAGLDRATYNNARELREYATEQSLIPKWNLLGRQLTRSLRDDFGFTPSQSLQFDTSEVRALQQDQHELAQRWAVMVSGGWATVAEARRAMNLEAEDHHDVFLRGVNEIEVANEPGGDVATSAEVATRLGVADILGRPEEDSDATPEGEAGDRDDVPEN